MAWYRSRHIGDGGGITPVGDAVAADVLNGKTFTNATDVGVVGTMPNNGAVSQTLNTSTTSYTVPRGYHNGSGTVSITTQTKSATPSTSAQTISPDSGKVLSSVSVGAISTQTKSASPSTSAQTISPDSGKYLSSVSISAISPQRAAGVAATSSGRDSTGPYVYFPYGWHPNSSTTYGNYTRLTEAQAIATVNKQEKTVTAGTSAASVTPDSGKLLSKVTYNPTPSQKKTSTPTTRSATAATVTPDSGKLLSKVTVNTNSVPNSNSGTKTITSSDTNWYTGNVDMGATNTYRYVNAVNVYNKGKADGKTGGKVVYIRNTTTGSFSLSKGTYYVIPVSMQNYNTSYLQQVYASGVWYGIVGIKSSVEYIAGNGLRYIGLTGDGLTINSNGRPVITDITDGTLCNLTEHVGKITLSKDTTINVTISYNGTGYYPVLALVLLPA